MKAKPSRKNESGSILIDAVIGLILVTLLGLAILTLVGQSFASMKALNEGLKTELKSLREASTQIW